MKSLYKFAGVIVLMCAMTLSTVAQDKNQASDEFYFSRCSDFGFDVSFDSIKNTLSVSMEYMTADDTTPQQVLNWKFVRFEWFANVQTEFPAYRNYDSAGVVMGWQPSKSGNKHANISVHAPISKAQRIDNIYQYTLQLTPEQVSALKSFRGLPGSCSGFSPGSLSKSKHTENELEYPQFSKCVSTFRFKKVSFDESVNEMTITVSQSHMPVGIVTWRKVKMYWFADISKDTPGIRISNAFMYWQVSEKDEYAVICATMPTVNVSVVNGDYVFVCKVSAEQVKFFKDIDAAPWQNKSFTLSTLSAAN